MRSRSMTIGALIAVLVLAGAAGLIVDETGRTHAAGRAIRYRPSVATPRPAGVELYLPQVPGVIDFDLRDERLYLLDPLTPAVHRVRVGATGYEYAGSFGRRGGGPGEFANPTGIAVVQNPERVAVIESGRIHFFDLDGRYLESVAPDLPCAMPRPRLGGAATGLFVHGDCVRRAVGGDTMMALLTWSPDGEHFRQLAADARFTLDGSFGNAFGASVAFAEGGAGMHVFGSGTAPCLYLVIESDSVPATQHRCSSTMPTYRLELAPETRAELEAMRKRNPVLARAVRVPKTQAPYSQPLMLGVRPAVLRAYSEDSVVLRAFASARDLAVLPLAGLVSCRREACLVVQDRTTGTRLRLHRGSELGRSLEQMALDR